jgi:uncharacterized integral membrane protein
VSGSVRAVKPSKREPVKLAAAALLGGLAVLFAVLNLDDVPVNWIFFTADAPLIIVIIVSGLVGLIFGAVVARAILTRGSKQTGPPAERK